MGLDGNPLKAKILDKEREPQDKFKDLWEHFYPRLSVYIGSFKTVAPSEHNDIISEVLLKVFRNLEKYNRAYSLSTWVYNIAKNYVIDLLRKQKYSALSIDSAEERSFAGHAEQKTVIDAIIEQDAAENCKKIISTLKERDRRLIFLRYYEDLNSSEISLIEGIPASTVRQRLMVIKSYIKRQIGDEYGD